MMFIHPGQRHFFGNYFYFFDKRFIITHPIMNSSAKQEEKPFCHLIGRYGDSWFVGNRDPAPHTLYKYFQQVTQMSKYLVFQYL